MTHTLSKAHTLISAGALLTTVGLLAGWAGTTGLTGLNTEVNSRTTVVDTASVQAEAFSVDPVHSNVVFKIRHLGASNFYGRFNAISGTFTYDEAAGTLADVSIEIPVESVDTNDTSRDGHIKGGDFFNVGQYPNVSFTSTGFEPNGEGGGTLTGNLTLHGVTKEVTAEVRDFGTGEMRGVRKMGFEAVFTIKRGDYGITTYLPADGSDGGPLGNTVKLLVSIEAGAE